MKTRFKKRLVCSFAFLGMLGVLAGCAFFEPLPPTRTLAERLAQFPTENLPLEEGATLYWNAHHVPYIEAKTDADLAFVLGLVHAHLRLGQMAILKRIAHGRIAEMAGPAAVDIDHSLRILNFSRTAAKVEAGLPDASKTWLAAYVRGINHYQMAAETLPHEYAVLRLTREPWTVQDVLTIARLAASDVNWLVWLQLLDLRQRADWPELWVRLLRAGRGTGANFAAAPKKAMEELLHGLGRSGSNSFAIAAKRSQTGAAMLANDPHLGITLPNLWLIAGMRSPSYQAVGLMVPGLPFLALGRNAHIAWGGTNLRAISSDLFEIPSLETTAITERVERIRVRWWFDRDVRIRETPHGPLLSDAPVLDLEDGPPFALRWMGHRPSDEITAMLRVNRARNFSEFRTALRGFSVPGQNMLYADIKGHIGQAMAVQLPVREKTPPKDLLLPLEKEAAWKDFRDASQLPAMLDPPSGILVSANNRPAETDVPIGYFFSLDDRAKRITALLEAEATLGVEDLQRVQRDVHMASSLALRELFLEKIARLNAAVSLNTDARKFLERFRKWDGNYTPDSQGAVAFELFLHHFRDLFYGHRSADGGKADYSKLVLVNSLLAEDIRAANNDLLLGDLRETLRRATEDAGQFKNWGEMHRLELSHPLGLLPLLGGKYRFADEPAAGSSQTVLKTAHATTNERHGARYGSTARHVSDLSDPDENYFALLGGQDGWLGSTTFLDQLPLWQMGKALRVPLRLETVKQTFPHKMTLSP